MPRHLLAIFLAALLISKSVLADEGPKSEVSACQGLPITQFESRLPTKFKRLTFDDGMVETFVDLWKVGSRPDLPKLPERVVVYAFPGLPLIIGYQERNCVIAYLAIDSAVLWRWLHERLGWKA